MPDLADDLPRWPCRVIGLGFALYGIALISYGTVRARQLNAAFSRGRNIPAHDPLLIALTVAGVALAAATAVLILLA